jgi:hypothetical protein
MVFRDAPPFFVWFENRLRLQDVGNSIRLLLQRTPTPPREHRACWGPRAWRVFGLALIALPVFPARDSE